MAKQKHSDEIQLYKLFKEAFDGEATVYNSIYYYDADDSSTKREVDMLVIYNNLIIVLGLNGQSGCNNKHANRSLRHNFKQMIGFINSTYKNGGVFYTTGSKDSKQRLRGVAHIFMISVVYNRRKYVSENEYEASSFSTTYTMMKDDIPYIYPITFTYSSLVYIIKVCCDHNLGIESFINYLFDLSVGKRYTICNIVTAAEFTLKCINNKDVSLFVFISKEANNVSITNGGLYNYKGLSFDKMDVEQIADSCYCVIRVHENHEIFKDLDRHLVESESLKLTKLLKNLPIIIENRANIIGFIHGNALADLYYNGICEIIDMALRNEMYFVLKHKGHVYCLYHDSDFIKKIAKKN